MTAFNKSSKIIAALDVGSSKICCIIARAGRDNFEVIGYGHCESKGIKNGIVVDRDKATLAVCSAIEDAEQMANERIEKIIVNISGDKTKSIIKEASITLNKNQPVNEAQINKVIEKGLGKINAEGHTLVHCLPTNYSLDSGEKIADPRNIYGETLSVDILLGFIPEVIFRNLASVIENAHLEITAKAFSAYASGLSCLVEDEREMGATIIDIGGGCTSIATFKNGFPAYFSSIPVGGNNITNDIAWCLTTSPNHAERLKVLHGCAFLTQHDNEEVINVYPVGEEDDSSIRQVPKAELIRIIAPRVEEIFELINKKLEEQGLGNLSSHRVVLTGGTSLLPGIADVAQLILDKQIRLGKPKGLVNLPQYLNNPAFSTCLGLLLFAQSFNERKPSRIVNKTINSDTLIGRIFSWLKQNY